MTAIVMEMMRAVDVYQHIQKKRARDAQRGLITIVMVLQTVLIQTVSYLKIQYILDSG